MPVNNLLGLYMKKDTLSLAAIQKETRYTLDELLEYQGQHRDTPDKQPHTQTPNDYLRAQNGKNKALRFLL